MKYAIINDQHFGVNGDSEYFHRNYEKFYANTFFPALKQHGVEAVLIPGDFWQSRKQINPLTLAEARRQFLTPLADLEIPVFISYGNHDTYYKNTNAVNTIDFLGEMYGNIEVVPEYKELDGGVCLMSWICPDNRDALLKTIETTKSKYLVGHFEIEGHMMTPGYPCPHGLPKSLFSRFEKVISGHFHVRGNDGKVFYTSNPSQTSWADYNQPKGFHIFDTASGELTPVDNPYTVYEVHDWSPESDFSAVEKSLADKIVKITIPSFSASDITKFKAFVNEVIGVAHKVTVVETQKFEGGSELVVQGEVARLSLRDVVKDYVEETAPENLKAACVDTMNDLYDRAAKES